MSTLGVILIAEIPVVTTVVSAGAAWAIKRIVQRGDEERRTVRDTLDKHDGQLQTLTEQVLPHGGPSLTERLHNIDTTLAVINDRGKRAEQGGGGHGGNAHGPGAPVLA